jgi:hypothetical protein
MRSRRVAYGGGANLILQFQIERGGDETKRCQNMNRRQRVYFGSMGRKRDTVRWRNDIGQRRGDIEEGKGRRQRQLGSSKSYGAEK